MSWRACCGRQAATLYPIISGVPSFIPAHAARYSRFLRASWLASPEGDMGDKLAEQQAKTAVTFSDKWRRFRLTP